MKHKVVIYERQASVGHEDNRLSENIRACEALATKHGFEITDTFIDKGVGGNAPQRPALNAMFDFIENEKEPVIVVSSDQHRIARNMKLFLELHQRMSKTGATLLTPERKTP